MRASRLITIGIVAVCLLGISPVRPADGKGKTPPRTGQRGKRERAGESAKGSKAANRAAPARPDGSGERIDSGDGGYGVDAQATIEQHRNADGQTVYSISASHFDVSLPLAEMAASADPTEAFEEEEEEEPSNPLLPSWRWPRSDQRDPVVQTDLELRSESFTSPGFTPAAPTTGFNFAGVGQSGGTPSDCNGSVGNNQFVETVNTRYQVWSLNRGTNTPTSILGPSSINTLWSGFGGACQTQNAGDPIVIYDKVADRWLISQFTSTASSGVFYQCVAVSTSANAIGTYARWAFAVPNGWFGDYPHIGAWSDAYYMMAHAFLGQTFQAGIFAAMDRPKMLAGNPAATWQVILDPTEGGHMVADLDGFAPPPTNAPGIFLSLHPASMYIYRMKVDFVTPANTTKTLQTSVPIAASTGACLLAATPGTCIPQPGTLTAFLDSLGDRLMFRGAYRNFVDHESLVISHSVDPSITGLVSGVRWYDFRLSGTPDGVCTSFPCLRQQGTIADVANGRSRWMPSIAMDGAENVLVGYSTSGKTSGSENHTLRYTGRAKNDPLGTMTAPETTMATGLRNITLNSRWGDYFSMSSDPFDDCTFWFVGHYIPSSLSTSWGTRIVSSVWPAGTGAGQCQASTCTARPASTPTIGSATANAPNQITVSWTGIAPQPGAYTLERATGACGSEGLYQPLAAAPGIDSSFVDTTVQGGLTYSYRVRAATDAAGKCQALTSSACVSATATGNCTLKPTFNGATSGTSANSTTCGVQVNWAPATSSCPLTPNMRYSVFRGTAPDFVPSAANRIATCVAGPSSYLDAANVASGTTYYYVVRAEDDSSGNGGECGGNEESNSIVVSGTAYGVGTQASPSTWTDGGGDGTAFLLLNVAGAGDTSHAAWRFVKTANDSGANHTPGGAYAYRNAGPSASSNYDPGVCAEMQTPSLTVGSTGMNLQYWERHQMEYHWDGVAVEYSRNGGAWTDVPAPSASVAAGCSASDTTTNWETLSCTGSPAANACNYSATKNAYNGPLGTGTACASWTTNATVPAYAHRCHPITGLVAGDTIQFRWRFASDPAAQFAGFYLDDVAVTNVRLPNACTPDGCTGQPNGTACNDGNACTQSDTCQGGVCTGSNPVTCTASDSCHVPGTCNPATGVCSNPNAPNGTACNDASACTQTDTCQGGVCTGSNPVTCTASDSCHAAGTCNPATGQCSNPVLPDGTACTDGDACSQTDLCVGGTCIGTDPVTCTASDPCHDAGICNPANGECSNPAKPDASPCSDGDLCTQTDTCESGICTGLNPVTCTASDPCHDAGTCDPSSGACSNPAKPDASPCSDGNLCTQADSCTNGTCVGTNPVVCGASDSCHIAGSCSPATGTCSSPAAPDGTACTDANACTTGDACLNGSCQGTPGTPPAEVGSSIRVDRSGSDAVLSWSAAPGATTSDVLRGDVSGLPVGPGGGDEVCLTDDLDGTTATDTSAPVTGDAFWYLVRGRNACGTGAYGFEASHGMPGVPSASTTCP